MDIWRFDNTEFDALYDFDPMDGLAYIGEGNGDYYKGLLIIGGILMNGKPGVMLTKGELPLQFIDEVR